MDIQKNIRVLGKGLTAQAIAKRFENVILYDESDFASYDTQSFDATIVSPGIPPFNKMVRQANNIQSDYDLFLDVMPFSVWISGTNGKTTTTQMIQHLLEKYGSVCGGNIGIPIATLNEKAPIWVLETSSFTLHYTKKARPNLYILLPISQDHISWHESFEAYEASKLKAMDNMQEGEIAIIPKAYEHYTTMATKIVYETSDDLIEFFNFNKEALHFKEPFLLDAVLAMAVGKILFDEADYTLMNKFKLDPHKVEPFYDAKKRLWIDDSKATNIDATMAALKAYNDKQLIYLILGGDDKGALIEPLFQLLAQKNTEVFAIGSNEDKLMHLSQQYNIKCYTCNSLENAVNAIHKVHTSDSIALLSPAAASLDQFRSYKHRGEVFKESVKRLS
jgi:UDP-N-acetylmuramoylalanine--D-glutamate ligase